jgi:hypothetical protein
LRHIISFFLEPASYFVYVFAIAIYFWSNRKSQYGILVMYYLMATLLLVKATWLTDRGSSNIGIYDILFLVASTSFAIYFYTILLKRWKKMICIGICVGEILYFILDNIIFGNTKLFDSGAYVILSTGIVIMIFLYLHQILTHVSEESLTMNFDFWFVSSLLIYHLGAFIIFLTFSYLTRQILTPENYSHENRAMLTKLWGVHNVLLFLSSLLTLGSVAWISYRKKSPSS